MKLEDDLASPQAWLARARSSLILAEAGQHLRGVFLEDLCFDAQQAAEKALKAVCIHYNLDFPRTHSLASLISILEASDIPVPEEVRKSVILTQYAVRTRYPGAIEPIQGEEYQQAIAIANMVVTWAETVISTGAV